MVEINGRLNQGAQLKNRKVLEMRAFKPWVQALHVDPLKFESWLLETPKHESVTFWCLVHGHIRSVEYLEWAKEYYGLAVIDEKYFRQPAARDLWTKIQTVANWSPSLLPVEEWDGTVFVACVEPPEDIHWSFPVQYVLAPARELTYHWERLNSEPTKVTNPSLSQRVTNPSLSRAVHKPSEPPKQKTVQSEPAAQVPKLTLNISDLAKEPPVERLSDELSKTLQVSGHPDPQNSEGSVVNAPEGLSLSLKPPSLNLSVAETKKPNDPSLEAPLKAPLGTSAGKSQIQTGFVLVQNTGTQSQVSAAEGEVDADHEAPRSLDEALTENQVVAWCFQQLKPHFRYAWILKVQGDIAVPYKWDNQARARTAQAQEPIDLKQPSLFRIVARTRMPYHGHVVDSPVNTAFFKLWGLRDTPPHVTAVPLLEAGRIAAILICAGEKPSQPDAVLRATEKVASQFMSTFVKTKAA